MRGPWAARIVHRSLFFAVRGMIAHGPENVFSMLAGIILHLGGAVSTWCGFYMDWPVHDRGLVSAEVGELGRPHVSLVRDPSQQRGTNGTHAS